MIMRGIPARIIRWFGFRVARESDREDTVFQFGGDLVGGDRAGQAEGSGQGNAGGVIASGALVGDVEHAIFQPGGHFFFLRSRDFHPDMVVVIVFKEISRQMGPSEGLAGFGEVQQSGESPEVAEGAGEPVIEANGRDSPWGIGADEFHGNGHWFDFLI
jgi:hypothetical protein